MKNNDARRDFIKKSVLGSLAIGTTGLVGCSRQNAEKNREQEQVMKLQDYDPVSKLVVKRTDIKRAKMPVIDVHTHIGTRVATDVNNVAKLVETMDRLNFRMLFDLSADFGEGFNVSIKNLYEAYPDRFTVLCKINRLTLYDDDFAQKTTAYIRECHKRGARGLKFNSAKSLEGLSTSGLEYRFPDGSRLRYDNPRFRPVWEVCAELNLPVLMHIADPIAFWDPMDRFNERYEELNANNVPPRVYSYYDKGYYSFFELLEAQERMLEQNRDTKFLIAHVGSYSENLAEVGRMLDSHPNLYVDTAQRIAELGRQPYTAREFLIKYQDRVLFGTDGLPEDNFSIPNFRFYETFDEYFHYDEFNELDPGPVRGSRGHYRQGRWMIYGVGLPDDVLKKIYHDNAVKLYNLPG